MPKTATSSKKQLAKYASSMKETMAKKAELEKADKHLRDRMNVRNAAWPKYKRLDSDVNALLEICVKHLSEANKKGAANAKSKGKPWKRRRLMKMAPTEAHFAILEHQKKNINRRKELVEELAKTVDRERVLAIATFVVSSRLKVAQGKEALRLVNQIMAECGDDDSAIPSEDMRLASETLSRFSTRLGA